MENLAPLVLERRLDSRLWGGTRLGGWLGLENPPRQLAESWQVYEQNRVVEGPGAGKTLAEVALALGADLLGTASFARHGAEFPLLAKFIDAADHLSIQVHPDDDYAHRVEAESGFHGKTEAWHILHAEPGAAVIHDLRQSSSRDAFAAAVEDGSLLELLRSVPVAAGDTIFVPAGTVHAINAGIMLFEIQQKSDLTYRVYDYQRRDAQGQLRELHLERALDVIRYDPAESATATPRSLGSGRDLLVSCPYFAMERWQLRELCEASTAETSFEILTLVDGSATLTWQGGERAVRRGESLVLPARLGAYDLRPTPTATLLRCYIPE